MRILNRVWSDVRRGQNLDLYVTLVVAIACIVLSLLGLVSQNVIFSSTLAVLILITINLLTNRYKTEELFEQLSQPSETLFREEFPAILRADVEQASEVWIIGISLTTTIRSYYSLLERNLSQGQRVRVLLVSPEGTGAAMAEMRVYGKPNVERNRAEISGTLDYLCDLKQVAPTKLEVRTLDYPISIGGFATDPDSAAGKLYLENYPFKTSGGALPRFVLHARDGRWYDHYKQELRVLWESATIWQCQTPHDH